LSGLQREGNGGGHAGFAQLNKNSPIQGDSREKKKVTILGGGSIGNCEKQKRSHMNMLFES